MDLTLNNLVTLAHRVHVGHPELVDAQGQVRVLPDLVRITEVQAVQSLSGQIVPTNDKYPIHVVRINKLTTSFLYSQVWMRRSEAIIQLAPQLTRCWQRFCITKELLHLYIGCVPAPIDANSCLKLAHGSRFVLPENLKNGMDEETFCLYLAIEVLLPWSQRMVLSDMKHNGDTPLQMATRYRVPVAIIEHYFDCGYAEISFEANKRLTG